MVLGPGAKRDDDEQQQPVDDRQMTIHQAIDDVEREADNGEDEA